MASITKLLRRQPQTSEAELEFVRERTVARLNGLTGESGGGSSTAVAEPIALEAPVEAATTPVESVVVEPVVEAEPEAVAIVEPVIVEPEPEAVIEPAVVEPEAVVEPVVVPEPEPEAVVEPVVEPEPEPEAIVVELEPEPVVEAEPEAVNEQVVVEPEPQPEAVVEPVIEPEAIVEAKPKRGRRWWGAKAKPEAEPEVESPAEGAETEPTVVSIIEEPTGDPELPAVELAPAATLEPEPEPIVEVAPEPVEPVAIPVVAEVTVDIRRESIWESKPPPAEAAPVPTPARPRPPRPARPRPAPVTKPAAVAAAPAPGTAFCPYCALSLVPAPTATRRCPRCRQRIIVKHVQGHVVYLTEASVAVFDAERQRAVDSVRWAKERTQWLKLATGVGASAEKVGKLERARLTEAVVASSKQLYMSTAERAFRAAKREDRWEVASRVRREQAAALHKAAGLPLPPPDDALALHREGVAIELRGINKMAKNVQLVGSNCCEACEADDGRTFRIVTEMRETRLPHPECPKGLCRCHWDLVVRDEAMVRRYLQRKDRGNRGKRATGEPAVRSEE